MRSKNYAMICLYPTDRIINHAMDYAQKRTDAKPPEVRYANPISPDSEVDIVIPHRLGLVAEYTISDYLGYPLDKRVFAHGNGHTDLEAIDIKAATWPHKDIELKVIKATWPKMLNTKAFILCRVPKNYHFVEVIGGIDVIDFAEKCYEKTHYKVVNLCVQPPALERFFSFTDLVTFVGRYKQ